MPERIQLRRTRGWRLREVSPDAIVVSRPTKYGNPFRIGQPVLVERYYPSFTRVTVTPRDRREATMWFSLILGPDWGLPVPFLAHGALSDLRGHDLACWCPIVDERGQRVPCHADVLLGLANSGDR